MEKCRGKDDLVGGFVLFEVFGNGGFEDVAEGAAFAAAKAVECLDERLVDGGTDVGFHSIIVA